MPAVCTVCLLEKLPDIDAALISGQTAAAVARQHGISPDSVKRHRRNHLSNQVAVVTARKRSEESAENAVNSVYDRLEGLAERIENFLLVAERRGNVMGGAALFREARQTLELIGKLTGEIQPDGPQVHATINITQSEEWTELLRVLFFALTPYAEARRAVADAMGNARLALPAGDSHADD